MAGLVDTSVLVYRFDPRFLLKQELADFRNVVLATGRKNLIMRFPGLRVDNWSKAGWFVEHLVEHAPIIMMLGKQSDKAAGSTHGTTPILRRGYFGELLRPWKLMTFAIGMAMLLYGAVTFDFSDWDVGVSVLMGGLTYLFAPWSVQVIVACVRGQIRHRILWFTCSLFVAWVAVDGSYVAYNEVTGHTILRAENFAASSALYFLAGVLWSYQGSLAQLVADVRNAVAR